MLIRRSFVRLCGGSNHVHPFSGRKGIDDSDPVCVSVSLLIDDHSLETQERFKSVSSTT